VLLTKASKKSALAQVLKEEKIVEKDDEIEEIDSGAFFFFPFFFLFFYFRPFLFIYLFISSSHSSIFHSILK
jgi:hypothetical protein